MDDPTPLAPRLEAIRQALLVANRIGVVGTKAIVEAGLGEFSSNETIGVLAHLASAGPSRPRDLLPGTRLTRGGLSNLFDRLESEGFITRSYGTVPGDRRGATVAITTAGAEVLTTINDIVAATLDSLRSDLDDLAAVLDSMVTEPCPSPAKRTKRASIGQAGLLGVAGAAITGALADVDPDDPSSSKTVVVLACAAAPGHTRPRELIEETGLSSSGVSLLLDRLEDGGLVRRQSGQPPDRRAVIVTLTDKGRRELDRRLTAVADHIALLGPAISDQDL